MLQKIRLTNNSIENVRIELSQFNMQFEAVKKNRCQLFNSFLKNVSTNLDRFYKELMHSNASQAFLLAENTDEPYLGGIMFNCIVPGKIFQPISCLSGGEKTLAAFAFIFSSYFERLPAFFIMDEIDGCLDNTNIAKVNIKVKYFLTKIVYVFSPIAYRFFKNKSRSNSIYFDFIKARIVWTNKFFSWCL